MNNLSQATELLHDLNALATTFNSEKEPHLASIYSSLANLYDHTDETTRFTIINGLAESKLQMALPLFRRALQEDENEVVRHEAAVALGLAEDSESVNLLCSALKDPSALVRHEAALALGDIGDERHLKLLQGHLEDDEQVVAISCRVAIARIRHRIACQKTSMK